VTEAMGMGSKGTRHDWAGSAMSAVVGRELPATAQKILSAAQRALARDGYEALTLSTIADEALETKSLVLYHFGRRANLEALLVDSLWHHIDAAFVRSLDQLPPDTDARIDALIDFYAGIAEDARLWRMYYDLLPSVIGDPHVRRNLARIYESYRRDINVRCLEDTDMPTDTISALSSPFLAVGEAIPLQTLLSPTDFDTREAFVLFGDLAKKYAHLDGAYDPQERSQVEGSRDVLWATEADPRQELPRPARRILRAAQRLLERGGLKSLTLDAIAEASGQPRSSVSYYYHGKQGLIDTLFASVLHSHQLAYMELFSSDSIPGPADFHERMFARTSPVRAFLLLLPAVLHDEELRRRAGVFYRELLEWLAAWMSSRHPPVQEARALASVIVACVDGVSIQTLYDPAGFDPTPALRAISSLIAVGLRAA
jgi:AcrR family transcriptional regulator